jgi:hypothetical protein
MRRMITFPRLGVLVVLAAALAIVAAQAAAGAGAVTVRGDQLLEGAGSCPGDFPLGKYRMAGDLVGCWYTDEFNVTLVNPAGVLKADGTEHFTGCLNTNGNNTCDPGEPYGTFHTSYTYTSKYAGDIEIHGRCHHPIVGQGEGAFENATGVISFKDVPPEGRFPYHGTITLSSRGNSGSGAAGAPLLSVGTPAEADASSC